MANEVMTQRGMMVRDDYTGMEQSQHGDTAMAAVAAREKALVEARFVVAFRNPRNWDNVRVRMMNHCARSGFAEACWYKKPTGRKKINGQWVDTFAEDLSVRFMEMARQEIGNLDVATKVTYEDDRTRIVTASVFDLERNNCDSRDIVLVKVTEKSPVQDRDTKKWGPPPGREVISERLNTSGETVYLCRATEDEIRQKMNSEISKAQRDETKRLIPVDILQDCRDKVTTTRAARLKDDPTAARKKIIDAFAAQPLNVMPDELVDYIGCSLEKCTGAQMDELRGLYTAIKDGEITMAEALKAKYDQPGSAAEAAAEAEKKLAALKQQQPPPTTVPAPSDEPPSEEEMNRLTREATEAEANKTASKPAAAKAPLAFGKRQQ